MARGLFVLVLVVAMVAGVTAGSSCIETFAVAGRKYKLKNQLLPGGSAACPEGNPSTVTLCKAGERVTIVGNFAALDLGVCDPNVNPYLLPADADVTYEQYGDQVICRIPGRVPSSFQCMLCLVRSWCALEANQSPTSLIAAPPIADRWTVPLGDKEDVSEPVVTLQ